MRRRLGKHDEEGHHLEVVDPLELPFLRVRAARREEAGDGALLLLADDRRDGRWPAPSGRSSCPRRRESPCRIGRRRRRPAVAADAELLEAVEHLFGLRECEQDASRRPQRARDSAARADNPARSPDAAASPSARRQKMTPGGMAPSPVGGRGRDGQSTQRQPCRAVRMVLCESPRGRCGNR